MEFVSIPDRDLGWLQLGAKPKDAVLLPVSIPDRDLGWLQLAMDASKELVGDVSIPDRDLGWLQQLVSETVTVFSFQGSFASVTY